jgi:hypothetical protein
MAAERLTAVASFLCVPGASTIWVQGRSSRSGGSMLSRPATARGAVSADATT